MLITEKGLSHFAYKLSMEQLGSYVDFIRIHVGLLMNEDRFCVAWGSHI